jgi:hypothetical protein
MKKQQGHIRRKILTFFDFHKQNPDKLVLQRQQDLLNKDIKMQVRIESLLLAFIVKKKEGYSIATQQIIYICYKPLFF